MFSGDASGAKREDDAQGVGSSHAALQGNSVQGGKGVAALVCFSCRVGAFYSTFPEPPLRLPVISIKNRTLLTAVIKNRGVSVLC